MKIPDLHMNSVHFSLPGFATFPILIAQKLAFCAIYFEKAIDELVPGMTDKTDLTRPHGWKGGSKYCKRNRVRPGYVPMRSNYIDACCDLKTCWEAIRECGRIETLHSLMCCGHWRNGPGTILGTNKFFKWNFHGVGDYTTIEFRQSK